MGTKILPGRLFHVWRLLLGLSIRSIHRKSKVSLETLVDWDHGRIKSPQRTKILQVANGMGIEGIDLYPDLVTTDDTILEKIQREERTIGERLATLALKDRLVAVRLLSYCLDCLLDESSLDISREER